MVYTNSITDNLPGNTINAEKPRKGKKVCPIILKCYLVTNETSESGDFYW